MLPDLKGSAEAKATNAVLRDLMGLMALPALWVGRDAATVLRLMSEAVETVVDVDASFVQVPSVDDGVPFAKLRVDGGSASDDQYAAWKTSLASFAKMGITASPTVQSTPMGPMRVIRLSMGFSASQGSVWFASCDPAFPSVHESACLRAVATLAATGLEAAAVDRERARASRVKDEFMAMLGHELRNPLAPIFMALELLKRKGDGPLGRPYEIIERQARHLSRLVDDLMDISRITNKKFDLHKEPVSIRLCLTSALESVGPSIQLRRQNLKVTLPDVDLRVFGDVTRLTQVFANILTNASKYTHLGGNVTLSSLLDGNRLLVSVQDDGPGISRELMPRLFGVFEQGSSTIDRAGGGLGIGLALVKSFVESHDGAVDVQSDGIGKGAKFTVMLPCMEPTSDVAVTLPLHTAAPTIELPLRTRMLVVDDNADAAELLAAVLATQGFEVQVSTDPFKALALAQEFRPDIAILDIGLPGMNGLDLGRALRACCNDAPVRLIALSGYGQPIDHAQSLNAGFEMHFVKPVAYSDLLTQLQNH